ncbi:hypothetical protein L1987_00650 [Smallanthus sonchifolius]|uniref:Uncharacterized protein n=1 Tax=Smallanthus sonchifolius TaxID=185202 RepID=A0ACB9K2X3_9ASTR|nr:hypothetical protein L1987_00650 [Smallanthus sonchifolius]
MHIQREAALERNISQLQIEKHSWLHKVVCFEDTRIQMEAEKVNLAQKDRFVAETMASLNNDNAKLQADVIEIETSINILQGIPSFSIPKEFRHVNSLISTTFLIATPTLETSNSSFSVVPTIVDVDLSDQMALLYLDKVVSALTDGNPTFTVENVILPGDMCGYATASFLCGVNFIQTPTIVLEHVDSYVGGKTDINHGLEKNLIGAFYQPQCVIVDTDTSNTLPDGELVFGLVEVVVVFQDEKESGLRAILPLGHPTNHAKETSYDYGFGVHKTSSLQAFTLP